jgi:hypothetical protein
MVLINAFWLFRFDVTDTLSSATRKRCQTSSSAAARAYVMKLRVDPCDVRWS